MNEKSNRIIFNEIIFSKKFEYINVESVPEALWIEQPNSDRDGLDTISLNKDEVIKLIETLTRATEVMVF